MACCPLPRSGYPLLLLEIKGCLRLDYGAVASVSGNLISEDLPHCYVAWIFMQGVRINGLPLTPKYIPRNFMGCSIVYDAKNRSAF